MTADPTLLNLEAKLQTLSGSHRNDLVADVARQILTIQPTHRDALASLALAHYEMARTKKDPDDDLTIMRQTLERALAVYPNDSSLFYLLYHYYLWYGGDQYVLARDCLLQAIKIQPNNAEYFRQLGEIYLINREADKAAKYLSQAVELAPVKAEYRSRLALALLRQHKINEALDMAKAALSDDPNDDRVLDNVGMIYILSGDLERANRFFLDAIKRDPTYNYFQQHIDWIKRELRDKQQRESQGKRYTPLYIRHKGSKRFFDEDALAI